MQRVFKAIVAFSLVLAVGLGSFAGGLYVERSRGGLLPVPLGAPVASSESTLSVLVGEVQKVIRSGALRPPSEASMTVNTVDGLLKSLGDKYATYFDPKVYKEVQMSFSGEFFGVGMTIGLHGTTPTIGTVFKGSPAEKAGIHAGDAILSVDGVRKANWPLDDVVGRIRGPIGTKVTIKIARKGKSSPLTFVVTRDRISIPNTTSELIGGNVGYVRLYEFNANTAADVGTATKRLARKGAKGFVLDLRENPGGRVDAAIELVSLYVRSGVVLRIDARGRPEESDLVVGGVVTSAPLVVLVDGQSASASEIVAGALQDHARAMIVGEKTYGKGSVQTFTNLSNGGAVKFTTAHYLTPKGHVVDGAGIKPDATVKMDPHLQAKRSTDTQLAKALQVLRARF